MDSEISRAVVNEIRDFIEVIETISEDLVVSSSQLTDACEDLKQRLKDAGLSLG